MEAETTLEDSLSKTGQKSSFTELNQLVDRFEKALGSNGVSIEKGGSLESACLAVTDVLTKHNDPSVRNAREDVRKVFSEVLGLWMFLTKVVRLHTHPTFPEFVPHLRLLNKGTVTQNTSVRTSEEATNKIFELLFALVLLDVGSDLVLDHPDLATGNNPDILVTLGGKRWGFACKTVYSTSGKTFFDNLKKGAKQIEVSEADIGCVMINFRNLIQHDSFWPILNESEHRAGAEPIFGSYCSAPGQELHLQVAHKKDQVVEEIGEGNIVNMFSGGKALPAFLAFCQTCYSQATSHGPVPASLSALVLETFSGCDSYLPIFDQINDALHERSGDSPRDNRR